MQTRSISRGHKRVFWGGCVHFHSGQHSKSSGSSLSLPAVDIAIYREVFHALIYHFDILTCDVLIQFLSTFKKLDGLSFPMDVYERVLYSGYKFFGRIRIVNIFSLPVACLLPVFTGSFDEQMFLI